MTLQLGLRLRIAVAIAAACLVTVFSLGFVLYAASERMEAALVEQLLGEELNALIQHHRDNPGFVPRSGPNISYYIVSGQDESSLPAFARGLAAGHHEIDIGGGRGDRDVVVRQVGTERYIVVYDIGPYETREQEFRRLLLISLAGAALLSLILGHTLAGFTTRQLRRLAASVDALQPEQAGVALSVDGQEKEVAILARAFDRYRERILTILQREQEFTANASHELRTPVTAIQTSCELLVKDSGLSAKSRERIGFIQDSAAQMAEHIRALLLLARERSANEIEAVGLLECIQQAAGPLTEQIERQEIVLTIDVQPDVTVPASAQALRLVLSNLLRNAVQATHEGSIRLAYDGSSLTIADTGSGIMAEQLPRIFERSFSATGRSDGQGIGLDIVRRICEQAGWSVTVSSAPQQGTVFTIRF